MMTFLECWTGCAKALLAQALVGEPELVESLPKPLGAGAFGFAAVVAGEEVGRFGVLLDPSILEAPLMGEGVDQKGGWAELLREVADSAAGELLARTGKKVRVERFEETAGESTLTTAFQLCSGDRAWMILVHDGVRAPQATSPAPASPALTSAPSALAPPSSSPLSRGLELLLDVELEASLRFGSRELALSEILELGPGDVVPLDRNVSDPVDLIVADKIVARGEVVLINGNFGLRITEVAAPRKRLESIRCLF
jgi:flagellar motor switch protein FliN/FliY